MEKVFMTIKECAESTGLPRRSIEKWLHDPVDPLPHIKTGEGRGVTRIPFSGLIEYAERKAKEMDGER